MNCFIKLKKIENYWSSATNCKHFFRSLKQSFLSVGQDKFRNKTPIILCFCTHFKCLVLSFSRSRGVDMLCSLLFLYFQKTRHVFLPLICLDFDTLCLEVSHSSSLSSHDQTPFEMQQGHNGAYIDIVPA